MGRPGSRKLRLAAAIVAIGLAAWLLRAQWLGAIGRALVHDDGPAHADAALVLGGDLDGNRILTAAGLLQKGYVPIVLVSGADLVYEEYECDVAIRFAVRHGCRTEWFVPLPHHAHSTVEEARAVLPVLRQRGVRSYLLVTSNYHTGRAGRIFRDEARRLGYDAGMRVVAAPDRYFTPSDWWESRDGRKTVFFEAAKTVATALGQ